MGTPTHTDTQNEARHTAVLDALRRYELAAAGFQFHHRRNGWNEAACEYHDQGCAIEDELFVLGALNGDYDLIYPLSTQERAELAAIYPAELECWETEHLQLKAA